MRPSTKPPDDHHYENINPPRTYTTFFISVITFLIIMIMALYITARTLIILCRNFKHEKMRNYYPMLLLMNFLSAINLVIILIACFLPCFEFKEMDYELFSYPFLFSLVTPTLIAAADFILCGMRLRVLRKNVPVEDKSFANKWLPFIIFLVISGPLVLISVKSSLYTMAPIKKQTLFWSFLIENGLKAFLSISSFIGYYYMQQSHKKGKSDENTHDPAILAQALPIAAFQTFTIIVQICLELPITKKLDERERLFLDVIFSATCSFVIPYCTVIGEKVKQDMLYHSVCCCSRPPRTPYENWETRSKRMRQKAEEQEAIKNREAERKRKEEKAKRGRNNVAFFSLEDATEETEL